MRVATSRTGTRRGRAYRSQLSQLADLLRAQGGGVLITVDEVHCKGLRELGTTIQHAFREQRNVAFVGAGLPSAVEELLSDEVSTFLRRADRRHLRTVSPDEVAEALAMPIRTAGRDVTPDDVDRDEAAQFE
ncbi:hypothetical protein [Flexivirga oryzae]|uniref:ATP-binding protein n=1 Tax=Flexivirga oryzae TaxID=1794944 RepID=A0A839N473_9MICO|nr:hypothetical protein [Flexivirga oryzae]MBB2892107.1 hypothetical protein [Flexivirga oryzae]